MRRFPSSALVALSLFAAPVLADEESGPVVVELFTSQGCSSCPPADAFLAAIAEREDVIALSLHVDYWDYLGWRDVFGDPAHTSRQRAYALKMKERTIYTPQMVVDGVEQMVGSHTARVEEAIARRLEEPDALKVSLVLRADRIVAEIEPTHAGESLSDADRGQILLVWWSAVEPVNIRDGENAGREIVYHNVVKGFSDLGAWRGTRIALTAPKPTGASGVAVFVQKKEGGRMLGAGKIMLK